MVLRIPIRWVAFAVYTIAILLASFGISYGVSEWTDTDSPGFTLPEGHALVLEQINDGTDLPAGQFHITYYERDQAAQAANWATINTLCLFSEFLSLARTASVSSISVSSIQQAGDALQAAREQQHWTHDPIGPPPRAPRAVAGTSILVLGSTASPWQRCERPTQNGGGVSASAQSGAARQSGLSGNGLLRLNSKYELLVRHSQRARLMIHP